MNFAGSALRHTEAGTAFGVEGVILPTNALVDVMPTCFQAFQVTTRRTKRKKKNEQYQSNLDFSGPVGDTGGWNGFEPGA